MGLVPYKIERAGRSLSRDVTMELAVLSNVRDGDLVAEACSQRAQSGLDLASAIGDDRWVLPDPPEVVDADLEALWARVRQHLSVEESKALGTVRAGISDSAEKPWAQTNDGEDRVNLTLELKPDQLELDLVGWKQGQSEALKEWLQSVPGEDAINALPGYELVAFARRAYKKEGNGKPWWQDETIIELGSCPAASFTASWISKQMFGLGSPKEEKPAFHVRRAWSRDEVAAYGDDLPAVIATEVKRLIPILEEIWAQGPVG